MHYHPSNTLQTAMVDDETFVQSIFHVDTVLIGSNVIYISISFVLIYTAQFTEYTVGAETKQEDNSYKSVSFQ